MNHSDSAPLVGVSHIRIIGKLVEEDTEKVVHYSASDERSYKSIPEAVADLAGPLRLLHPAPGSPYRNLFGSSAALKGSGGYEFLRE